MYVCRGNYEQSPPGSLAQALREARKRSSSLVFTWGAGVPFRLIAEWTGKEFRPSAEADEGELDQIALVSRDPFEPDPDAGKVRIVWVT